MKRTDEVAVGIFITLVLAIGIAGTLYLARKGVGGGYTLHSYFGWGAGLKQGQPVRLAGVQVGAVDKVTLRQDGVLDVNLKIDKGYKIPLGATAAVKPEGFFGDQSIALTPCQQLSQTVAGADSASGGARVPVGMATAKHAKTTPAVAPSSTPRAKPCPSFYSYYSPNDTVPPGKGSPTIDDILLRVDTLSRSVNSITGALTAELVQGGGLSDLHRTIASTNALVMRLNQVAAAQSAGLTLTLASIRRTTSAIDSAQVDSVVHNFKATSENLKAMTGQLTETSEKLNQVMAKLQSNDGTAGKLLNDPALYDDLKDLMTRLDSVMADFQRNPKKYVPNVKVF